MQEYCVVLRTKQASQLPCMLAKRCYLRARTANQAMLIAAEDPEWRVIGIEPAAMSLGDESLLPTTKGSDADILTRKILGIARSRTNVISGPRLDLESNSDMPVKAQ